MLDEQAVSMVNAGPCRPRACATRPEAMLNGLPVNAYAWSNAPASLVTIA